MSLLLGGADASMGSQGYQLDVTSGAVVIPAQTTIGLFNGVQTLRQLLPADIESSTVRPGPWVVPGGHIVDYPRFTYRGDDARRRPALPPGPRLVNVATDASLSIG
ncbi:glycoside hydrolase family 20 zincin-like fold domain-containing protein [Nonomuraea sp. NBC_00507]